MHSPKRPCRPHLCLIHSLQRRRLRDPNFRSPDRAPARSPAARPTVSDCIRQRPSHLPPLLPPLRPRPSATTLVPLHLRHPRTRPHCHGLIRAHHLVRPRLWARSLFILTQIRKFPVPTAIRSRYLPCRPLALRQCLRPKDLRVGITDCISLVVLRLQEVLRHQLPLP